MATLRRTWRWGTVQLTGSFPQRETPRVFFSKSNFSKLLLPCFLNKWFVQSIYTNVIVFQLLQSLTNWSFHQQPPSISPELSGESQLLIECLWNARAMHLAGCYHHIVTLTKVEWKTLGTPWKCAQELIFWKPPVQVTGHTKCIARPLTALTPCPANSNVPIGAGGCQLRRCPAGGFRVSILRRNRIVFEATRQVRDAVKGEPIPLEETFLARSPPSLLN